jgi:dipeptidyl aminopeptidase/acylaminoacyl peptidase
LTVAEKSDYKATSRHADVMDFCQKLAKASPLVKLTEMGKSHEGRTLPLLIIADPPISTPEEAAKSGKPVVFAFANIHAGEVCGKEALQMLARDIVMAKDRPLLKDVILVFNPILNADGNERMSKFNRPGQVGPEEGMGIRYNALGLDLNRDFVKLDSPEIRALVRAYNRWNPALIVDCHTTNGSYHRYTITYDGPAHPACDHRIIKLAMEEMFPFLTKQLKQYGGYDSFWYGNFSRDRQRWETYGGLPRYSTQYSALRNQIAILSEAYSYAPYKDRIFATRDFVRSICDYGAANKEKLKRLLADARHKTEEAGKKPTEAEGVVLQHKIVPMDGRYTILGYVEEVKDGRRRPTKQPKDYPVTLVMKYEPTLTVSRPQAYFFPGRYTKAAENLQRHGIEVEELREDIDLEVEVYRVTKVVKAEREYQDHLTNEAVEVEKRKETHRVPAGSYYVKTAQPFGTFVVYLLEPQSDDGLAYWNYFDEGLAEGKDFPVLRLPKDDVQLNKSKARPLPEDRAAKKLIDRPIYLSGSPVSIVTWLEDGEHYLQNRRGGLHKVHARTGHAQPWLDRKPMEEALAKLPTVGKSKARTWANSSHFEWNPQKTGALFTEGDDLYYATFDGKTAVRLTKSPGEKELVTFSPDGKFIAFVHKQNLFVVDIATQTERALTADGGGMISNGKADWVYFEEIYDRDWRAYWWSPDGQHIAFLRLDDGPVHKFTVLDPIPVRQHVEQTPYPKAGDPNPKVKLGIVNVNGSAPVFAQLGDYSENSMLILRSFFSQDGKHAFCYVTDRAQTWLDMVKVDPNDGRAEKLFRETTKAWVDDPHEAYFLKDGSFLFFSARDGWKHLYHVSPKGQVLRQITSGDWEVKDLLKVDEEKGWVYFTGFRDSPIAPNLYRAKLDGHHIHRLTLALGSHGVRLSPKCNLFVDTVENHRTPSKVRLYDTEGNLVRVLDSNPVYAIEDYQFGKYEMVQIPTPDGFLLEGTITLPPHFDPKKKYPVWFKTYAGPHYPSISDTWGGGHGSDQYLAYLGFIVFHCDPRSASGKGAKSAWTAYRQLGVQETKDIETAIKWLCQRPYVDANRIGMSGHSYGGYITAYAMTHTKLFKAGIAGAPVTDWRNYDSIYTERFMNTPQENPEGYDKSSVVKAARHLHGRLLIAHGFMDDNVHLQNTLQFMYALQNANKDFEIMIYPRGRHGWGGAHYPRLQLEFMMRELKPEGPPPGKKVSTAEYVDD